MKKKWLEKMCAAVLTAALLTGCGSAQTPAAETAAQPTDGTAAEQTEAAGETAETEGLAETSEAEKTAESQTVVDAVKDWAAYDELIAQVKTSTDTAEREALMHQAEDMLMATGAVMPIYYYNDIYMMKDSVQGAYASLYGYKYFMFASTPTGTLRANFASEPASLDPALNYAVDASCLLVNSFSGLFMPNADGEVVPDLVSEYEVSEDGLTYTFTLLPDLKWSDGSELNANDFVYSWNRVADPATGAAYSYIMDPVAVNEDGSLQVEASEDGLTLTVHLDAPCPYFLDLCAFPVFFPVKQEAVEAAEGWEDNPGAWCQEAGFVSNGAFICTGWNHSESMTYTKNPYYHRADEVSLETIEIMLSGDTTAIFAAYSGDNLDFIDAVPTDQISLLSGSSEFYVADSLGTFYSVFNVTGELFADKTAEQANAMRKAISLLLDRDYIADVIGQTGQQAANTFIPAGMADGNGGIFKENDDAYTYPEKETAGYYDPAFSEENVTEAIALLESAGYQFDENGMLSPETPLNLEYLTTDDAGSLAVGEVLQQDLGAVGINLQINATEWMVFLEETHAGHYDMCSSSWVADFNDPINMLECWTSDSGNNTAQFGGALQGD